MCASRRLGRWRCQRVHACWRAAAPATGDTCPRRTAQPLGTRRFANRNRAHGRLSLRAPSGETLFR
ncbi:MAG: hypothetical protein OXE81_00875 [Gammaproteobacteria bacterium]|nr:hypothetical protein [Gammaproteobacteria bacterium]